MAAVPEWLRGRNVTVFNLIPQTDAANGTLTPGTTTSLAGTWQEIDIDSEAETEEISPADATRQNHMLIKDNYRFRCTGIIKRSSTNQPAAVLSANDYFQMNCTRGGQSWSGYFVKSRYSERIRKGASTWEVELIFADTGSNLSYS